MRIVIGDDSPSKRPREEPTKVIAAPASAKPAVTLPDSGVYRNPGNGRRCILVCGGIGDNVWLIQKLVNAKEEFNWFLPNDSPRRGSQIFELLGKPTVLTVDYGSFDTGKPLSFNVQAHRSRWCDISFRDFYLQCNNHLLGRRIEEFLPDLPTSFEIEWKTSSCEQALAQRLFPASGPRTIGLYASSYPSSKSWDFWKVPEWVWLATKVRRELGEETRFVVMGAAYDLDLGRELFDALAALKCDVIPMFGLPLGVIAETLKRLDYFFAFPSGLPILATTVKCPTLMFYPKHLASLMETWASPEAIRDGSYHGMLFCTPEEAVLRAFEVYHLPERPCRVPSPSA